MKRATIILILLALVTQARSQEQKKSINFIISIDEKVVTGSMAQFRIIALFENGTKQTIEADYYPGKLSLQQTDYDKLLSQEVITTYIAFDYSEYCKNKQTTFNYEIDIKKGWLMHYYYVLYIYNLDKRKYKNIYDPIEGENYTFEFDYPGGSTKRIKKKGAKEDCN